MMLPLYCFPPIDFVAEIIRTPRPMFSLGERFEKQTYRNRFEIAGANGQQLLSIPLIHKSTHGSMAEVQIDHHDNWKIKHWRSIETAYRKSPFFEYYAHHFEPLFKRDYVLISEMNLEALHIIKNVFKIKQEITLNTEYQPTIEGLSNPITARYNQVFADKNGFLQNLSILDLIFNEGPMALDILRTGENQDSL